MIPRPPPCFARPLIPIREATLNRCSCDSTVSGREKTEEYEAARLSWINRTEETRDGSILFPLGRLLEPAWRCGQRRALEKATLPCWDGRNCVSSLFEAATSEIFAATSEAAVRIGRIPSDQAGQFTHLVAESAHRGLCRAHHQHLDASLQRVQNGGGSLKLHRNSSLGHVTR